MPTYDDWVGYVIHFFAVLSQIMLMFCLVFYLYNESVVLTVILLYIVWDWSCDLVARAVKYRRDTVRLKNEDIQDDKIR